MKKSLLVLILAAVMAVPAFAQKGDMSVNGKLGLGISNNVNISEDSHPHYYSGATMEMPVSIGAEFFYGLMDNLSVGAGVNYNFGSNAKTKMYSVNTKLINFYLAVRPEFKVESDIFSSVYVIGQIGGSSITVEGSGESDTLDMGIHLGFGAGTIIKDCIVVELIVSSSNGDITFDGDNSSYQYTATTINVGYKFNI